MSKTPTTPFIPPLPTSPDSSPLPQHPPVIPTSTPNWNLPAQMGGGYTPYSASPYSNHSPFIPDMNSLVTPGVIPGILSPQQQPKVNRNGLSEDFTGYPQGPGVVPPMLSPMSAYSHSLYSSHPNSPHYPNSAPSAFQNFNTPWTSNSAPLPGTPWTVPPHRLPPQPYSPAYGYGPPPPLTGPPPTLSNMMHSNMMGGPPQHIPPPQQMNGPPNGWPGVTAAYQFYGQPDSAPWMAHPHQFGQPPYRLPPEPPAQIFDRMDPFTEGEGYGAVLEPFLVRIVNANVRLNPLIMPLPDDGSDAMHLIWNMLFPTSTIQLSTDPSHVSWSKGRNAPATFPRISSLRIVSDTIPWVLNVKARDINIGVTCGEVIDSIAYHLCKFSDKHDYERLHPSLRPEVGSAYRRNRSREPGVPGGQLGQGMKRLDFLRLDTMFAGIEINDRVVKKVCGDVLPCVFVLKCSKTLPTTRQEVEDRQTRLNGRNSPSIRPRSRASSTNARIMVQSPTISGSDDGTSLHP